MTTTQIVFAIFTLVFGGVSGAAIRHVIDLRQGRIQPVGYRTEVVTIAPQLEEWQFHAKISIQNQLGLFVGVDQLDLVKVEIINRGNKDLAQFSFGLTLPSGVTVLSAKTSTPDRHHTMQRVAPPQGLVGDAPETTSNLEAMGNASAKVPVGLDYCLRPFNRGEVYGLQLVTTPNLGIPGMVSFESREMTVDVSTIHLGTAEVGLRFHEIPRNAPLDLERLVMPLFRRTALVVVTFSLVMAATMQALSATPYLFVASLLLGLAMMAAIVLIVAIPISGRIKAMEQGIPS